jgi:hypothetical protein
MVIQTNHEHWWVYSRAMALMGNTYQSPLTWLHLPHNTSILAAGGWGRAELLAVKTAERTLEIVVMGF